MPKVTNVDDFNGFVGKVDRLNLTGCLDEIMTSLQFDLLIEERKHANGTKGIRVSIDSFFENCNGWNQIKVGGIDWTKRADSGGVIGLEVQVSGRSDLLAVDILHLREEIDLGNIDVGVIVVPDDELSRFLTDRTPNRRTALKHVNNRAADLPIRVISFCHDGVGTALSKMKTNLGKSI